MTKIRHNRKMHWQQRLILLISLFFICQTHATTIQLTPAEKQWLAAHPEIKVAPDPDYPPFEFINDQGVHQGLAADYLKLVGQRLGIQFRIMRLASWDACLKQAEMREVDMWSAAAPTPQREAYMLFTKPFVKLPGSIITQDSGNTDLSLKDLDGQDVVVVRGYLWQDHITNHHPDIKLVLANSTAEALRMVSFGRVAAMVGDTATANYYQAQENIHNLMVAGSVDRFMDLSLAVRSDWPELRDILQKAMDSIDDEEVVTLRQRWSQAMADENTAAMSPVWLILIILAGICGLLIAGLLLINLRLVKRWQADAQRGSESSQEISKQLKFNRRKILTYSALSLVGTTLMVIFVTTFLLYRQAFNEKRLDLMQIVSSQARLINAVAEFDEKHHGDKAADLTFSQVKNAHENANRLGKSGEFVFGYRKDDKIVFPMRPRYAKDVEQRLGITFDVNEPITIDFEGSLLAEPMRRALSGKKGTMVGRDYRGEWVLAAYQPLTGIDYGIVGNIDIAEVRDPFVHAGMISLIAGLVFTALGVWVQVSVTSPLIKWIQQQKDFLETVIDSLSHPFYVVDAHDYSIKIMNTAAKDGGGGNALTCHALTHRSETPCQDTDDHPCPLTQVKETKEPVIVEHIHPTRQGEERHVEVHGYPIFDAKGQVSQMIEYSLDITDRKKAEQELIEAREAAETANRAKSDFLSNMSHELRTPLNGVLGYVQILLRDQALNQSQKQSLSAVQTCGEQLLALINDILDLAKIERGRLEYAYDTTDLSKLVKDVHDIVLHRATDKGLAIKWDIDPQVPRGIHTDAHKLRQILLNLTGNAVKFTEAGYIRLHVSEPSYQRLRFAVEDTGIGIPPHKIEEIFDPFKQAQAGHSAGGTGLGLAISRRLVKGFGGELGVESQEGQGSIFWFEIPCQEVEDEVLEQAIEHERDMSLDPVLAPGQDITVLIADDREANQQILAGLMQHAGFKTDFANNGQEALDRLQAKPYPLVLMDIRMPVMNGIEATQKIRENDKLKDTIVIAVSASVFDDFRHRVKDAGFDGFLGKPLQAQELYQALRELTPFNFEEASPPPITETTASDDTWILNAEQAIHIADTLCTSIDLGDIGRITSLANDILQDDNLPSSLGQSIQDKAMNFDFDALRAIADRVRAQGDARD